MTIPDDNIRPFLLSSRHRNKVIVSIMLAAMAYLAAVFYVGYEQILNAFMRIGAWGWMTILLCSMLNYCIRYIRWQYYVKLNGHFIPHYLHLAYYLSAFSLTTTPGKAGETIRSVLLRPHGVHYHTSLACFVIERFLDLVVVTLFSFLVITINEEYAYFIIFFMIGLLLAIPVIRFKIILNYLVRWHHENKETRIGRFVGHVTNLLQYASKLLVPRVFYYGIALGIFAWSIQGLAFYLILILLGFKISLVFAMGIYAVSLLAGAASFIPGGIGSTEVVMGLLLSAIGADNSVAVAAPLISRLSTLWFAVVVGLIAAGTVHMLRVRE